MEITHLQLDTFKQEVNERLEGKVSYSHFYWVIGSMIGVVSSILLFQIGLIFRLDGKIESVDEKVGEVSETTSGLLGEWKMWTKD